MPAKICVRLKVMTRTPFGTLVLLALAAAFTATWPFRGDWAQSVAVTTIARPLSQASSWRYLPSAANVPALNRDPSDVLIVANGSTLARIAALRQRDDGRRRAVLAAIDLASVSEHDAFWQPSWSTAPPTWLLPTHCQNSSIHGVQFWQEDWHKIIFNSIDSALSRVIDLGVDGVHLDGLLRVPSVAHERPTAARDMALFVIKLAEAARAKKPGFIVTAEFEPAVFADEAVRSVVDGVSARGIFYGEAGGQRRPATEIFETFAGLRSLQREGKQIFAVEFVSDAATVDQAAFDLRRRGIVPGFEAPQARCSN